MNRVSLSFLVDTMDKRRGGCAPNIAYTLALLGERPLLMATAGEDFGDYRQWLDAAGIDTTQRQADSRQVLRLVLLQHRRGEQPDRVVLHRRDGRCRPAVVPLGEGLRPGDHRAERSGRDGPVRRGVPDARHPVHLRSRPAVRAHGRAIELRDGITGATIVIVNDYELELLRQKTGMSEADILVVARTLIVTRGENGSSIITARGSGGRARRGADRASSIRRASATRFAAA